MVPKGPSIDDAENSLCVGDISETNLFLTRIGCSGIVFGEQCLDILRHGSSVDHHHLYNVVNDVSVTPFVLVWNLQTTNRHD
jgi:hypothetical protein